MNLRYSKNINVAVFVSISREISRILEKYNLISHLSRNDKYREIGNTWLHHYLNYYINYFKTFSLLIYVDFFSRIWNSLSLPLRLWSSAFSPVWLPWPYSRLPLERSHDIYLLPCTLFLVPPGEIVYNWPYYEILPLSYLRKSLRKYTLRNVAGRVNGPRWVILNNDCELSARWTVRGTI